MLKRERIQRAVSKASEVPGVGDKRPHHIRAALLEADALMGRRAHANVSRRHFGAAAVSDPPANTVAPVVSGSTTLGATLSTTDGTWTGTAPIAFTYQWQRGGVDISGETDATYVVVADDFGTNIRCVVTGTNEAGFASANSNNHAIPTLQAQINTIITGYGFTTNAVWIIRTADLTLETGDKISQYRDSSGNARHFNQATDANRPTYEATAINGKPGASLDGGDFMVTGNYDASGSCELIWGLFQDAAAGSMTILNRFTGSGAGVIMRVNTGGAGTLRGQGSVSGNSITDSAASYPMTSPGVVCVTFDSALTTHEAKVWHDGVDVSGSYSADTDNATTTITGKPMYFGALAPGSASFFTGKFGIGVHASGTGPVPAGLVDDVTEVMKAAWGLA